MFRIKNTATNANPFLRPLPPPSSSVRRLLMSSSSSSSKSTPSLAFSTPVSLSDWLKPRLPTDSFSSWGVKPGTKTVSNLWLEISAGETSLNLSDLHHHPIRTVHVASVKIRHPKSPNRLLLESRQLLSDGTVRPRHRPLSEKMKPGETVAEAVDRAIKEELGFHAAEIVEGSYVMKVEEGDSVSYPGLPARYVLHTVDALVDGLPDLEGEEEFSTEEVGECGGVDGVFVKRHYWKWVDQGDNCGSS
ncbi:hypothetical protein QJS10_CPB14g00952 [Acorus calamus]|uniref:Nudix hydrolase domain-containing protein n=1 Tax=Acorus calamus TaxID=4465 RepID=A0AAV9DBB5_ACOCL|nr:hypothetical protein QJS10_CPB14g00952 [Acorus calamus]